MERRVYANGRLVPESEAVISIFDVGRLYGATFYESIRTFGHRLFKLGDHFDRLRRSLAYAGLLQGLDFRRVEEAVQQVLEANEGLTAPEDDLWICVEVTPGTGFPMPLAKQADSVPTVLAYSSPLPYAEYARCYTEGKAVVTSLYRNIPPQCFEQRCKNRSRLPHFLSKLDGKRVDPQAFALMLDVEGFIAEGTGANIFFVLDGVLATPTTRNILVGVSRQYAIELAGRLGIRVREGDLTLYEAYNAQEAFWTTTSYCILPISRIDGRRIGSSWPGPVAARLLELWSREVGVDIVAQAQRFTKGKVS
jgi:branched-chain amino acid aminotransferase